MSAESQIFPVLPLVLAFGILLIYALVLRIRLWFYQSIIKTVKDIIPTHSQQSNSAGSGGCLTNLAIGIVLLVVFISLLAA